MHTQFVPAGRNPEPMKIQLNCDVETSRDSDYDNKKSVWLENSKLIHQPINDVNELLRAEALRTESQKFEKSKSQLCQFPVNQALCEHLHDFLCVCNSAPVEEQRSALNALSRTWRCGRFKRSSTQRRRESVISESKTKTLSRSIRRGALG